MQGKRLAVAHLNECLDFEGTKRFDTRLFLLTGMLIWVICVSRSTAVGLPPAKNVLILNSFTERQYPHNLEPLEAGTRSHINVPVNFHVEYLDSQHFGDEDYKKPAIYVGNIVGQSSISPPPIETMSG